MPICHKSILCRSQGSHRKWGGRPVCAGPLVRLGLNLSGTGGSRGTHADRGSDPQTNGTCALSRRRLPLRAKLTFSMSDRSHWNLRGPVRSVHLKRTWRYRNRGSGESEACEVMENGDRTIVECRPDGAISKALAP